MPIRLITIADFTNDTFPLPESLDEERLVTAIDEAQNLDLRPLLGDAQFSDLLINKADAPYPDLINGVNYENENEETIIFLGLKMALVYWTMAHFTLRQQTTFTSHGFVVKREERSEAVEGKEKSRQIAHFRSVANQYWIDTDKYMRAKISDFPLYKNRCKKTSQSIRINDPFGD